MTRSKWACVHCWYNPKYFMLTQCLEIKARGYYMHVFLVIWIKIIPEPTARSAVRRGLLIPQGYLHPGKCEHSEVESSSMIAGASLWLMGGPPTDLKNMADCQEWKGQRFKKIYVRKTTQHEEKFFKLSFKGMIRFDLNLEHDEVYGKFVLTVCICSILYFCKKFADCKKTDSASLSQEV